MLGVFVFIGLGLALVPPVIFVFPMVPIYGFLIPLNWLISVACVLAAIICRILDK